MMVVHFDGALYRSRKGYSSCEIQITEARLTGGKLLSLSLPA